MSKNYFTDEQVEKIVIDSFTTRHEERTLTLTHSHIKALMNLAVEEAIGEPYCWEYRVNNSPYARWSHEQPPEDAYDEYTLIPLYSVKELEN